MNKEFVKDVYENVVDCNIKMYKDLFENTEADNNTIDYWKNALSFYNSLNENQKNVLFQILKQTIVDTASNIFGILDNSVPLSARDYDIEVIIDGESTDAELQDEFLLLAEEADEGKTGDGFSKQERN